MNFFSWIAVACLISLTDAVRFSRISSAFIRPTFDLRGGGGGSHHESGPSSQEEEWEQGTYDESIPLDTPSSSASSSTELTPLDDFVENGVSESYTEYLEESPDTMEDLVLDSEEAYEQMDFTVVTEDDSSAFVDRMELADAYDEGEAATSGYDEAPSLTAISQRGGSSADDTEESEDLIAVELTEEMKRTLMEELKYHKREVDWMRPEIAAVLVEKNLRRPVEGVPTTWYVAGSQTCCETPWKVVPRVAIPVAAAALALYKIQSAEEVLPALEHFVKVAKDRVARLWNQSEERSRTLAPGEKTNSHVKNYPAHSVQPYPDDEPEGTVDATLLDRIITAIGDAVNAFLNIRI